MNQGTKKVCIFKLQVDLKPRVHELLPGRFVAYQGQKILKAMFLSSGLTQIG